ncbi:RING-type domain-containing protein [Mycena kentingensis (nom. inval.)]|nr:RING-type domain-containing protein [Mycena kentingensis (nom. inval.)]
MADTIRRTRSVGDAPATAEPFASNLNQLALPQPPPTAVPSPSRQAIPDYLPLSPVAPAAPAAPLNEPAPQVPGPGEDASLHARLLAFFGYGRGASRARKQLVSLFYNLCWGFVQIVLLVTMLSISATTTSPTIPGRTEFAACERLSIWNCIYVFRVISSASLTYWGWRRDREAHARANDAENAGGGSPAAAAASNQRPPTQTPAAASTANGATPPDVPPLPHTVLYSRLSILSSLFTLSWFLTAHILLYSSLHTCRFSSPHVFWLTFGILGIMYLVVLEVILLGFIVFVVAPILFLFWNIFLMCLGRHPLQNPGMIRPDIGKLSPSVVDKIPLVMYIPPPPDAVPGSIPLPQAVYSYPPKSPTPSAPPRKHRFKFLRRSKKQTESSSADGAATSEKTKDPAAPQTWEDHWEHTGYPFVVLEGNRAACAVCLMDFEEPKRADGVTAPAPAPEADVPTTPSSPAAIQEVPVEPSDTPENALRLEDAGEGATPLRLLACGHAFHQTCVDPWLTDVSGRCPVCQRPVEILEKPPKKKRRNNPPAVV